MKNSAEPTILDLTPGGNILFALAIFLLAPSPARGQEEVFRYRVYQKISPGQKAGITLSPNSRVDGVKLVIKGSDKSSRSFQVASMKAGSMKDFFWKQKVGKVSYKAHVQALVEKRRRVKLEFPFEVVCQPALDVKVDKSLADLENKTVVFSADRRVGKVELEVTARGGQGFVKAEAAYQAPAPGTKLKISWQDDIGEVLKLELKVYDVDGFWTAVEMSPFKLEVVHEDARFEFGKTTFVPGEEVKLDTAIEEIKVELDKAKKETDFPIYLYIAGCTDTVGSPEDNLKLSRGRARTIGTYFRSRGLKISIYYVGLGESVLAVKTPDDTPREENRRAIYILSSYPPRVSGDIPRPSWKKL